MNGRQECDRHLFVTLILISIRREEGVGRIRRVEIQIKMEITIKRRPGLFITVSRAATEAILARPVGLTYLAQR